MNGLLSVWILLLVFGIYLVLNDKFQLGLHLFGLCGATRVSEEQRMVLGKAIPNLDLDVIRLGTRLSLILVIEHRIDVFLLGHVILGKEGVVDNTIDDLRFADKTGPQNTDCLLWVLWLSLTMFRFLFNHIDFTLIIFY